MAKNVVINEATYAGVPYIEIPLASGSGNAVFYDTGDGNLSSGDLRENVVGYGSAGQVTGSLRTISAETEEITTKAQEVTIAAGIHSGSGKVRISQTEIAKLTSSVLKKGTTVLGVEGGLTSASVTQNSSTKVLTIS